MKERNKSLNTISQLNQNHVKSLQINTPSSSKIINKNQKNNESLKQSTGCILRKTTFNLLNSNAKETKLQQIQGQKDKYSSIFSQFSNNILNDLMNFNNSKVEIKSTQQNINFQTPFQNEKNNISKTIEVKTIPGKIQQDCLIDKELALKGFKEIFHEVKKQIIDLFSKRLETETVERDGEKILLLKRMSNYGSCKENTLFHLQKYLDLCLKSFQFINIEENSKQNIQGNEKRMNYPYKGLDKIEDQQQTKILYQMPREISYLFIECIEETIGQNEYLKQKEFLISIFKKKIELLQPATPILEICSTEYLQKIIEIIYDRLEEEPYLNSIIPKKTPMTLRLANQLSEFLLTKNYQMLPSIIRKKFKEAAIFKDPTQNILWRLEFLEQIDKDINTVKQDITTKLKEELSKDHFFERVTQADFYVIKCLIRLALENKAKLADEEVNIFIEAVEETRYMVMPYLYQWAWNDANTLQINKSMTSKIIALGSDFLNQYFPQQNIIPKVNQFCKLITTFIITQPNFQQLKKLLTLNQFGKIIIDDQLVQKRSYCISKSEMQQQDLPYLVKLKQQLQFITTVSEILLLSLQQLDNKLVTQKDIYLKFQKIGWSFIPKDLSIDTLVSLTNKYFPTQINLSNIQPIVKHMKTFLNKKYIFFTDIQIVPLCEIGREFLLSFNSVRNTYSIDDIINSFRYYDIQEQQKQLSYLFEAIEFALINMNLWTDQLKNIIQEVFTYV